MKPNKRQKLCQNCEGDVDLEVIVCPYCAADLREEKPEQAHLLSNQDMTRSLYPPPYPIHREEKEPEKAPLPVAAQEKAILIPTLLVAFGAQLLLLALFLLFFSRDGAVHLKWDARYWFLYAMASAPFLYFGYQALSKLD